MSQYSIFTSQLRHALPFYNSLICIPVVTAIICSTVLAVTDYYIQVFFLIKFFHESCSGPLYTDNPCIPNPCQNNGLCYINDLSFVCICTEGYTEELCDISKIFTHVITITTNPAMLITVVYPLCV